ncbi:hypothetical protein N9L17_01190 [Candidatus Pelagibacter bacterium]|jgi:hypothetical protein|nr:hypothetical protein [Candidatus Pelagibacter bacterium]
MKKIIINLILAIIFLFITLLILLATVGIETNKFNKLISDNVNQSKNINLDLNTIKFKLDPKKLSLFLETKDPKINYRGVIIPVQNVQVFVDFLSLLKSNPKIKKTNLIMQELDTNQLNNLSKILKPSNFKNLMNNKVKEGKLISQIEIFLDDKSEINNFIAKGKFKNFKAELFNGFELSETNLTFIADKNDILIKKIEGKIDNIKISDGDIKLNFENGAKVSSNFDTNLNLNENFFIKQSKFLNKLGFYGRIKSLNGSFKNNFYINFDNTYKVQDYNYSFLGKIEKSKFDLPIPIKNTMIDEISKIYLSDFQLKSIFTPKKNSINGKGKYSFNNTEFYKIDLENNFSKDLLNLKLNFDYVNKLKLDFINYEKLNNSIANLSLELKKNKDNIDISKLYYIEGDNSLKIDGLRFKKNKFLSFKKIDVATLNNKFFIKYGKNILIKGSKFDATNLAKFLGNQNEKNNFKKINSNIEIDFKNIKVPMSEELKNFKLIGEIKKGQFVKITSKGDFGGGNFLDISMKKDTNTDKKYLEIYSDLTRPLLTEYSFFKGLSGGKLLFTSIIDNTKSNSKLKIENFKVVNAPGVIKLLSLADLRGLADVAEGEGLSFDILEIDMERTGDFLKLSEILALGPSMSVLIEGYQDEKGLTSLRGTLVPAKTLNKLISKIPIIGNIVIPKEVGEGLFGISFKMKGPKGNIKTTINPIKTLTPRFIQKIVERKKNSK